MPVAGCRIGSGNWGLGTGSRSLQLNLTPCSLYVIEGEARWRWQHSIAATREQRYSLTLRTGRGSPLLLDHINVLGRYEFILTKSVRQGRLRPLRDPKKPDDLAA